MHQKIKCLCQSYRSCITIMASPSMRNEIARKRHESHHRQNENLVLAPLPVPLPVPVVIDIASDPRFRYGIVCIGLALAAVVQYEMGRPLGGRESYQSVRDDESPIVLTNWIGSIAFDKIDIGGWSNTLVHALGGLIVYYVMRIVRHVTGYALHWSEEFMAFAAMAVQLLREVHENSNSYIHAFAENNGQQLPITDGVLESMVESALVFVGYEIAKSLTAAFPDLRGIIESNSLPFGDLKLTRQQSVVPVTPTTLQPIV